MRKFEYKYRVDEEHGVVVAISSYAGKTIVGIARCAPGDTFDVEIGKKLAAARCSLKVAEKRMKRAEDCYSFASDRLTYWKNEEVKMKAYNDESVMAYLKAFNDLKSLENLFV